MMLALTNNMWDIGVVIRELEGYIAAAAIWSVDAFPDSDIGETLDRRLAIQFDLDMEFFR